MTDDSTWLRVLRPWAHSSTEIKRALEVDEDYGLDSAAVAKRLARFGPNRVEESTRRGWWAVAAAQLRDMVVWLLAVGAALSFALGENEEGAAIVAVLLINAVIGFVTELRATRSMEALKSLSETVTMVRREGRPQTIPSKNVVPGDLLLLSAGDVVAADARLVSLSRLIVDESMLTGESFGVTKSVEPSPTEAPVADRLCMVFKGTFVTRGLGEAVVVATGSETELGRIAGLVASMKPASTPLERRLAVLGRRLAWLSLATAAALVSVGYRAGHEPFLMIETGISLAVATVPEGLPLVATIALARGVWRMARRRALIRRLDAVETLGSTSLILTDKTGTLTANRLTVAAFSLAEEDVTVVHDPSGPGVTFSTRHRDIDPTLHTGLHEVLLVAALCNDTNDLKNSQTSGDPLERALLETAARAGLPREKLLRSHPEQRHEPFDAGSRMMATFHEVGGQTLVAVKGAPEAVFAVCTAFRERSGTRPMDRAAVDAWSERNDVLAERGFRVLALASKTVSDPSMAPYEALVLVGLVALIDPPRPGVREAVARCRDAGLRVVMLTGDHPKTAINIARAVGLFEDAEEDPEAGPHWVLGAEVTSAESGEIEASRRVLASQVIARASPEQKLVVIGLQQQAGHVVAMFGDGVNDAPALRKADIGVAMGQRGTQVARETADMVLQDDELGTVVSAIEQGRVIFRNIRKFARYLLSCNGSEILVIAVAMLISGRLPLLPLQILFLNLVTDVFPALALAACEGSDRLMSTPPRRSTEPILTGRHWLGVGLHAALLSAVVLAAWWMLGGDDEHAATVAFFVLAFAQLGHVFNMTEPGSRPLDNEVTRNPWIWGAVLLCSALLALAATIPVVASALRLVDLSWVQWLWMIGLALVPMLVGRNLAWFMHRNARTRRA